MPQTPVSFDVQIYGQLTPYQLNPGLSKARVSVFRKYANANGSYFNDDVAEAMIGRIAGVPIVGHYDTTLKDFTSHLTITDTKAYGFVPPENYNFAWQTRVEADGKTYEYACFDVLLWTDRYEEAKEIINKGQSMELNPYRTFGEWVQKDGALVFEYTSTEIYGLCVLGDSVRPCFDAACFYTQNQQRISSFMEAIKAEIKNNFSYVSKENDGGNEDMPNENIIVPQEDSQLLDAPESMEEEIAQDDDHPAENFDQNAEEQENIEEENASVSFSQEDMDRAIEEAVTALRAEYDLQITELNARIAEFEAADYPAQIEKLQEQLTRYQSEEAERISTQKDELIASYSDSVDSDLLDELKSNKDNYSLDEIESKLAVNFARSMRVNKNKVLNDTIIDEDSTLALLNRHLQTKRGNK